MLSLLHSSHNVSNHGNEFLIDYEDSRWFLCIFSLCVADEAWKIKPYINLLI